MRTEHDALGSRELPADALYGIHTLRAAENFPVSPYRLAPPLIRALAQVKLACARTNARLGYLDNRLAEAIETACLEIIGGSHQDSFITDPFQGGAGTSANMNMNEVVANRACQLLGGVPGQHSLVSPLNHVNMHQSLSLIHISTIIDEFELGTIDRSTTLYKKAGSNSPFTIG